MPVELDLVVHIVTMGCNAIANLNTMEGLHPSSQAPSHMEAAATTTISVHRTVVFLTRVLTKKEGVKRRYHHAGERREGGREGSLN